MSRIAARELMSNLKTIQKNEIALGDYFFMLEDI